MEEGHSRESSPTPLAQAEAQAACHPSQGTGEAHAAAGASCCPSSRRRADWLLWGSATAIVLAYLAHLLLPASLMPLPLAIFTGAVFEFMNAMWWGVVAGILFVGILNHVPRELVLSVLGREPGLGGIMRATAAGLLLDLCSHGILLVGMKFYERGATLGQTMAFLIASPWNSISLTIILIALIGIKWTLVFMLLSAVIAIASGLIFERLVAGGILPDNPGRAELGAPVRFWPELRRLWRTIPWSPAVITEVLAGGMRASRMILRWLLLGVVIAALLRVLLSPEAMQAYFGPSLFGLAATLVAATVIEVCSEGSSPIAADLINRGGAPGNGFTFLMAGASTDYTEVMALREQTRSWKIALFLPLVTVPQILLLGYLLNQFSP
ncbi:MAG: ATPase [Alphaproteobacteria bacterium]|nr:MAG: ATPase [Alphaproteobacteria bacterium]